MAFPSRGILWGLQTPVPAPLRLVLVQVTLRHNMEIGRANQTLHVRPWVGTRLVFFVVDVYCYLALWWTRRVTDASK